MKGRKFYGRIVKVSSDGTPLSGVSFRIAKIEDGMIRAGTMPKFAWCTSGVSWFQSRNLWLDGSAVPEPGMIIFYDWYDDALDEEGEPIGQDGEADHVGIVEKVENGRIYTVEGNTTDRFICAEKTCPIGYYEILGYGCPEF